MELSLYRGSRWGDSGSIEAGLCKILDTNFREHLL
jgi:hypothetical protein